MSMYTIYIRKENEEVLRSIKNKSEFFNALLAKERFGEISSHAAVGRLQDEVVKRVSKNIKVNPDGTVSPKNLGKPSTLNTPFGSQVKPERLSNGVCKIHGIPLDGRGKCLQKGCKYA